MEKTVRVFDFSPIFEGLQAGLSRFNQSPTRSALLFAPSPSDDLFLLDPHGLTVGHEPALANLSLAWDLNRAGEGSTSDAVLFDAGPDLAGVVGMGVFGEALHYQLWLTDHPPDLASVGPIKTWLARAALFAEQDQNLGGVLAETAGRVLKHYAAEAVREHLLAERRSRGLAAGEISVRALLDLVMEISKTPEEGSWPRGDVAFVEPEHLGVVRFAARFPDFEPPAADDPKHVRKLLQAVEGSARTLVCDGVAVLGVAETTPDCEVCVRASFRGGHGFLYLGEELVAGFADGDFRSSTRKPNLVRFEEALLEIDLPDETRLGLKRIVSRVVDTAQHRKHGCTIVVDLGERALTLAGQPLAAALELASETGIALAAALAKVDGALHIGADLKLHAFACLLDGRSSPGENRARGARYNSALRFTRDNDRCLVIVVSADRPVSVIQGGVELTAHCALLAAQAPAAPPRLKDVLEHGA